MAMHESDVERVCRQGLEAWKRLKKDKNWADWRKVGEALIVGRDFAFKAAGVNRPQGKGYNLAFGEWLQRYKLDDMDKGTRSRLFEVMDNLGQIEDWRQTLPLNLRLSLNHPNAVLRKWKAHMAPEKRTETGEPKPTLRDSVVNLSEENEAKAREIADLKIRLAESEAAREAAPADAGAPTIVAARKIAGQRFAQAEYDDDLLDELDPDVLISLAEDLNNIAGELKRRAKAKERRARAKAKVRAPQAAARSGAEP
jgi:hypothetical protein